MPDSDEKILVRSVNWLGDAIMTTPALIRLREARPKSEITLLSPKKLSDLWKNQSCIDKVITFPPSQTVWRTARLLRRYGFTTGIAFPTPSGRPWSFGSLEFPIALAPAVAFF